MQIRHLLLAGSVVLAACGDDGGSQSPDARPSPDAMTTPDAAPAAFCITADDATCGYSPSPVTPADVPLATQQALAERFNPAQVMTGEDIWAVSVDYLLIEGLPDNGGSGLLRAEHSGRLNFSYDVDETTAERVYGDPHSDLTTMNWHELPTTVNGAEVVYYLDLPGTNTGSALEDETWTAAWRDAQGYSDPAAVDPSAATHPPLQYAHLFWLDRDQRLLAIQYWFYYPFDKFQNNHEGDWEHTNVVLRYPETGEPTLVGAQFSYHGKQTAVRAEDLYRIGDDADGDHIVVFTGGLTCTNYLDPDSPWCGDTSGATLPYPGVYDFGYQETIAGDAGNPGRAIHATDFTIQLLPRIEDVDFDAEPQLSWYGMPFLVGEPTTAVNAPAVIATNNHRAPVGPGTGHGEYDLGIEEWNDALGNAIDLQALDVPGTWTLINEPAAAIFD